MKIGVYGGTFNPPHLGHVTAARAVFELLKLDLLLPFVSISHLLRLNITAMRSANQPIPILLFLQ